MKNALLLLTAALLLFASCNREDKAESPAISDSTPRFYGVMRSEATEGGSSRQGVAQRTNLWYPCSVIPVKFLNGSPALQSKVKACAKEWEQYAGITFDFVSSGDALVRVSFDHYDTRYITWSYIGTDCRSVASQSEPTMNFFDLGSLSEQEQKGDILRAFGQALGLELEHRNLSFTPNWVSEAKAEAWWALDLEDVDWASFKKYVYDPLNAPNVVQTAYDASSIMVWPFPRSVMRNGVTAKNHTLSDTDKAFIAQLYPKCEQPIVVMKTKSWGIYLDLILLSEVSEVSIKVDWGDGSPLETVTGTNAHINLRRSYPSEAERTITLYGYTDKLLSIYSSQQQITELDASKNTKLSSLSCRYAGLKAIALPQGLQELDLVGNKLSAIDLSKNTELKVLVINQNQLSSLDISKNLKLESLNCPENLLTTLDLSHNTLLGYLSCYNNPFETNATALMLLGQSLADRTGQTAGRILMNPSSDASSWFWSLCAAKNWTR